MAQALGPDHVFVRPKKEISNPMHIQSWLKSEAYHEYIGFVECLNEAVRGKPNSASLDPSPTVLALVGILEKIGGWIDEIPPIDQPQRFGNKAFRDWYSRVSEEAESLLRASLPVTLHPALHEVSVYLVESVGNSTRIDYGTGHEMSFVIFLYTLFRLGALDISSPTDKVGAVSRVFQAYLTLVRKLQIVYRMEPAGSHGAWSLDDFQFVPFIWGSSQLNGQDGIEPGRFTDSEVIGRNSGEYLFFGCLAYTLAVKTGPFHEHSNQLWNISGAQSWSKVNGGLVKMYKAEVLSKFPVIQHTLFGSIFPVKERAGPSSFQVPARPERRHYVPNPKYPDQVLTSPTGEIPEDGGPAQPPDPASSS